MLTANPQATMTRPLVDVRLPAASVLLSEAAVGVLGAAAAQVGAHVVSARRRQVLYRPGRRLVVRFATRLRAADGRYRDETLVAATGTAEPHPDVMVVADGNAHVEVWRYPFDPELPGLAAALDVARVDLLLTALGAGTDGLDLRPRAYRPERRAVIEATTQGHRLFVKVVPPAEAAQLHRRHRVLAQHLPVPESLGWDPELGIVALQPIPGLTVREALRGDGALPAPEALLGLLDQLAEVALPGTPRTTTVSAARTHGRLLSAVLPEVAERIDRLLGLVGQIGAPQPQVTIHGDFYEAQLLVADNGEPAGLLDIDGAGPGERIDDLATMLGHLAVLDVARWPRAEPYGQQLFEAFARVADPAELRRRTAAVLLGLATGPFRVQQDDWPQATRARLALAEQWAAEAARR